MDGSLFGKLPAELRNTIYDYALIWPREIRLTVHELPPSTLAQWLSPNYILRRSAYDNATAIGLISTCKQIRDEALPIFLSGNRFDVHTGILNHGTEDVDFAQSLQSTSAIHHWILSLKSFADNLTNVTFYFSACNAYSPKEKHAVQIVRMSVESIILIFKEMNTEPRFILPVYWGELMGRRSRNDLIELRFSRGQSEMLKQIVHSRLQEEEEYARSASSFWGIVGIPEGTKTFIQLQNSRRRMRGLLEALEAVL